MSTLTDNGFFLHKKRIKLEKKLAFLSCRSWNFLLSFFQSLNRSNVIFRQPIQILSFCFSHIFVGIRGVLNVAKYLNKSASRKRRLETTLPDWKILSWIERWFLYLRLLAVWKKIFVWIVNWQFRMDARRLKIYTRKPGKNWALALREIQI